MTKQDKKRHGKASGMDWHLSIKFTYFSPLCLQLSEQILFLQLS